jgi:hypothetical protein
MAGYRGLAGLTKRTVLNNINLCLVPEQEPTTKEKGRLSTLILSLGSMASLLTSVKFTLKLL